MHDDDIQDIQDQHPGVPADDAPKTLEHELSTSNAESRKAMREIDTGEGFKSDDIGSALAQIDRAARAAQRLGATHWVDELAVWRRAIGNADSGNLKSTLAGAGALVSHIAESLGARDIREVYPERLERVCKPQAH